MTGHSPRRSAPADGTQVTPARGAQPAVGGGTGPVPALLIAAVRTAAEADQALAAGADMIDASELTDQDAAALRGRHPRVRLWHGSPAAADADRANSPDAADAGPDAADAGPDAGDAGPDAADAGQAGTVAGVIATASVLAWLGTPAIRTRHVLQVRRAIDMTCTIAGTRLPALTTRGLA